MSPYLKRILLRGLRAFVAGALGSMVLVAPTAVDSWDHLAGWLSALSISAIIGGVTGVFMALDKWYRSY